MRITWLRMLQDIILSSLLLLSTFTRLTVYGGPSGSVQCSSNGVMVRGQCRCFEGYFGVDCSSNITAACAKPGETRLCSGRGDCVNGICDCYRRRTRSPDKYSGMWCQCDDFSCPFFQGRMCGGPERGVCSCGMCQCQPMYTGDSCSCSTSVDTCVASNGKICNDFGTCNCGMCKCSPESKHFGPTCEISKEKHGVCRQVKECVQCRIFNEVLSREECANHQTCGNLRIQSVDKLKTTSENRMCEFKAEDDCTFYFTFEFDSRNRLLVKALLQKVCPGDVEMLEAMAAADSPQPSAKEESVNKANQMEGRAPKLNVNLTIYVSLGLVIATYLLNL